MGFNIDCFPSLKSFHRSFYQFECHGGVICIKSRFILIILVFVVWDMFSNKNLHSISQTIKGKINIYYYIERDANQQFEAFPMHSIGVLLFYVSWERLIMPTVIIVFVLHILFLYRSFFSISVLCNQSLETGRGCQIEKKAWVYRKHL